MSSTARELLAVLRLIEQRGPVLQGQALRLYLDSDSAVRNLLKGGSTTGEDILPICMRIHAAATALKITLHPVWVPREKNVTADKASKLFETGVLLPATERRVLRRFGTAPIFIPIFSNIGRTVEALARKHVHWTMIYPAWRTQAWWPRVASTAHDTFALGCYDDVFGNSSGHPGPGWQFVASAKGASTIFLTTSQQNRQHLKQ